MNSFTLRRILVLTAMLAANVAAFSTTLPAAAVPPTGIPIPDDERAKIERGLATFATELRVLEAASGKNAQIRELLPDVLIFHKAVDVALRHDEFLKKNEFQIAHELIAQGLDRARSLQNGEAPWTEATGLVVRGYRSRIDESVQPYGLVVPTSHRAETPHPHRLDVWLHGRDNNLTELKFVSLRQRSAGEFTPKDTIVLHPYGRYCNAFKFAGEVDVFEALDHAKSNYRVDSDRVAIRGFSMGGGGCWHLAAHHANTWAAAAPGAGFSETFEYLGLGSKPPRPAWEQRLWGLTDATRYAENLFGLPTVAYSGGDDKQKQAADIMARFLQRSGLDLTHVIGPKKGHKYHPDAKREIDERIDAIMKAGRDSVPLEIRFTTATLQYNRMRWLVVDKLEEHWKRARVQARIVDGSHIEISSSNVVALSIDLPSGQSALPPGGSLTVTIDGSSLNVPGPSTDRSLRISLAKRKGAWTTEFPDVAHLVKRHGLQGPIDDAFLDRFIMVEPTGKALVPATGEWLETAHAKALTDWRIQFRGNALTKKDRDVTEEDIASSHLVLWGDPGSNSILDRIIGELPLSWDRESVSLAGRTASAQNHVPMMIFPNPLNPDRYVVLNSGFTFDAPISSSNADQTAKLPDYAIVNIHANRHAEERFATAGFFNEEWK
jgi:pimeloyl-ACP methyl ester carboxylesterase